MSDSAPKRKPGRPKKIKIGQFPKQGVVDRPSNYGTKYDPYAYEVIYQNPSMFKAMLEAFRDATSIKILFDKERIKFHSDEDDVDIYAVVSGCLLNCYYCAQPLEISIGDPAGLRTVMQKSGNYSRIHIYSTEALKSQKMMIKMIDDVTKLTSNDTIVVSDCVPYAWDVDDQIAIEPWCTFTMTRKLLKRLIKDEFKTGSIIQIRVNSGKLTFEHSFVKAQGSNTTSFDDLASINFKYTSSDPTMVIMIKADVMAMAATIDLDENVTIRCTQEKPLLAVHYLDYDLDDDTKKRVENTETCVVWMIMKQFVQ
jgi:hypothetical protein